MKKTLLSIFFCLKLSWKTSPFYTLVRLIGQFAIPIIGIFYSYLIKYSLDIITGNFSTTSPAHTLVMLLIVAALVTIVSKIIDQLISYCAGIHKDLLDNHMAMSFFDCTLNAEMEFFDNPEYYDKMSIYSSNSYAVTQILWNALGAISSMVSLASAFIVLSLYNWVYGLSILLLSIPSAIASRKFTQIIYRLNLDQINALRKTNYIQNLTSNKNYAQDIRVFDLGAYLRKKYSDLWTSMYGQRKAVLKKRSLITILFSILPDVAILVITIDIALKALFGLTTVGDFTLFTGLASTLISSITMFVSNSMSVFDNRQKIDSVKSFTEKQVYKIKDGTLSLHEINSIEFQNISFSYPETNTYALKNVSFVISAKEKAALVGVNGAGKTTILKLLLRFYDPDCGVILINQRNIKEYRLKELRRHFSLYTQNSLNYGFSIEENILLSDLEHANDTKAFDSAISCSGMDRIIKKSPLGVQTPVFKSFDDNGIELSIGECQKLALARTLFRHCSILVLDEPSSSLDPEAEAKLFDNIDNYCKDKILLIVSHKLSNVSKADKIIVIENGEVVEIGTHSELLTIKQRYAVLYNLQAQNYVNSANSGIGK